MSYVKQIPAKNEAGLVALLVVGIMIILLSLITVAFTKLMGRESRQALDRVLSTQAYYAAQSGLNDAKDYINTHPQSVLAGSNCNTLAQKGYPPYLGPQSDTSSGVNKVTCVVADTAPEQLFFNIPAGRSKIFEMSSSTDFGNLLFSWDNSNTVGFVPGNYKNPATTTFSDTTTWNNTAATAPVLEVTYYPMPDGGGDLPSLLSRGRTIFLYPSLGVGKPPQYNSSNLDGSIVNKTCQAMTDLSGPPTSFAGAAAVYHCNTIVSPTISPILGGQTNPKYIFVKVSSFYGTASLAVRAVDNSGSGTAIAIHSAQAVLDSTGKGGSDVLKRLQTIIDYRPRDLEPGGTIETITGLCKRLEYNLSTSSVQVEDFTPDLVTSPACHTSDHPGQPSPL